jgi:MATE family multidrug resistance protein
MEKPDWRQIGGFARLGIPGGMAYLVEVTSFTLMALFIARLGTVASASHQIAASLASVLYMVPLSIAIACSARVSFWTGAGQPDRAASAVWTGFRLSALSALALSAILIIANEYLAALYSRTPAVAQMAAGLLVWVAVYHLGDAMQAVAAFLLRCYRITLTPLLLYSVMLWGLGLLGGYLLAYRGLGPLPAMPVAQSFWAASTAGMLLVALSLTALLRFAVRRSIRDAVRPKAAASA